MGCISEYFAVEPHIPECSAAIISRMPFRDDTRASTPAVDPLMRFTELFAAFDAARGTRLAARSATARRCASPR